VFQRTPPWIVPRWDRRFTRPERWMFRHLPVTQRLARTGIYWSREAYVFGFAFDPRPLTAAPPPPASPTFSCWWGPTPAWVTRPRCS
jgi:cation diffusion facilitator CzcD-associated flavoprotein CzcO